MNSKIIVMSGLPGSGKSSIAEKVAKLLGLPIFSVDPIESAIIKAGIDKSFETGLAAYLVAESLADEQVKLGNTVVIDAVNAEEEGKDVWRRLADKHNLRLIIIETFINDIPQHKERLKGRVRNLHGISEVTCKRVEARQTAYSAWKEPLLRLDSTNTIESNVKVAIKYIQSF